MKTLYVDHSIVTHEPFWPAVEKLVEHGGVRLVWSIWNLVEIACANDEAQKERRLAFFLDKLSPLWVMERVKAQKEEVRRFLWNHKYGVASPDLQVFTPNFSAVALRTESARNRTIEGQTPREWMRSLNVERLTELKKVAPTTLAFLQQKGSKAIKQRQQETFPSWMARLLPPSSPTGGAYSQAERTGLLTFLKAQHKQVIRECPAIAAEDALTIARTAMPNRRPQMSDGIDLMHTVVAMAYSDFYLLRDGFAAQCATVVKRRLKGHQMAKVCKDPHALCAALGV